MTANFQIKLLTPTAQAPVRGSSGAIGLDLFADLYDSSGNLSLIKIDNEKQHAVRYNNKTASITLLPNQRALIPSGISMVIPEAYYGRIAPRSGLALNSGINIMAGVLDHDFRGPVGIVVHNCDAKRPFLIEHGMRIAQLILERASIIDPIIVDQLDETFRQDKGFGSTGQ